MISFLNRNEIDEARWNDCIRQSPSGLPYGYTWYLDSVSDQWDALMVDDYEVVFPLVWRKRFLIYYLFQPFFAQQLGAFSGNGLDEAALKSLLDAIPSRFRFIEISLNYMNPVRHGEFEVLPRTNLCLSLNQPYDKLRSGYHENAQRNIHKAEKRSLNIRFDLTAVNVIEFFKTNTGIKIPEMGEYNYGRLHRLIEAAGKRGMGSAIGVFDGNDNLLATGFFVISEKRIINLLPSIDDEGKNAGAGFYLVDHIIKKYAGSGKVLDFEGSMIAPIARFYKSFGAVEQGYWRLRRNNLPWPVRWMKG